MPGPLFRDEVLPGANGGVCSDHGRLLFFEERVHDIGQNNKNDTADDGEPQVGDLCEKMAGQHGEFGDDRGDKCRVSADLLKIKCDEKYPENRPVE
jgi:hypothetical protein